MEVITLLLLAFGLSFDSFAVSVSSGMILPGIRFFKACIFAFSLAFFQGLMPVLGWYAGLTVRDELAFIDHWIAFGLLGILGIKMILESLKAEEHKNNFNPLKPSVLLAMSLATSIDALIVGVSFAFIQNPDSETIILPVLIIGSVTFIVSMLGILFGKKAGTRLGKRMEMLGGVILIAIGFKILVEHLWM